MHSFRFWVSTGERQILIFIFCFNCGEFFRPIIFQFIDCQVGCSVECPSSCKLLNHFWIGWLLLLHRNQFVFFFPRWKPSDKSCFYILPHARSSVVDCWVFSIHVSSHLDHHTVCYNSIHIHPRLHHRSTDYFLPNILTGSWEHITLSQQQQSPATQAHIAKKE